MKEIQETPNTLSKISHTGQSSIDVFAAQCDTCKKWRVIQSEEEFEEIRSRLSKEPFSCNKRSGVSCEDPADIEYNASRTWVIDKPNIQKTPEGFKRHLVLHRDYSKLDTNYIIPKGKRVRSENEIAAILEGNPRYQGVSPTDIDYGSPKVMDTNYITPKGKRVRSQNEIAAILEGNPRYQVVSPTDIDYGNPKVMDTNYIAPKGKRVRSENEIAAILEGNPRYQGVSPTDFDYGSPNVMEDTVPVDVIKMGPGGSNKRLKLTKDGDK